MNLANIKPKIIKMEHLVTDVLSIIADYLNYESILNFKQVNKKFNRIVDDKFWLNKFDSKIAFPEIEYLLSLVSKIQKDFNNSLPTIISDKEHQLQELSNKLLQLQPAERRKLVKEKLKLKREISEEKRNEREKRNISLHKLLRPYQKRIAYLRIQNKLLPKRNFVVIDIKDDNLEPLKYENLKATLGKKFKPLTLIRVNKDNCSFLIYISKNKISCTLGLHYLIQMCCIKNKRSKYDLNYMYSPKHQIPENMRADSELIREINKFY